MEGVIKASKVQFDRKGGVQYDILSILLSKKKEIFAV
jgi:hypothetical protein